MERNNYIQNKGLRVFVIASILTAFTTEVNTLLDGVIVSQLISPDALSVISLTTPLMTLLLIFVSYIGVGSSILVTKEMGLQNYTNVSRLFTTSMIYSMSTTGVMAAISILFSNGIGQMLTTEARLLPELCAYLPAAIITSLPSVILILSIIFVKSIGRPEKATRAVVMAIVTNIAFDLLFVEVLKMGVAGTAWGTTASYIVTSIYLCAHLFAKDSITRWVKPQREWFESSIKGLTLYGLPSAAGTVAMAALITIMNMLIQKIYGANGMYTFSIIIRLVAIFTTIMGGVAIAVTGIGGVMLGERDVEGYRNLVGDVLKKVTITIVAITVLMMIYPDIVARLFGASGEMLEQTRTPLRITSMSFFPIGIFVIATYIYLMESHTAIAYTVQILYPLLVGVAAWVISITSPEKMWYSIPIGTWMTLLATVCYSFAISRKNRTLNWFTLISKYPNDPNVSLSAQYNRASVAEAIEKIHTFIDVCELDKDLHYNVESCLEEVTTNLIAMTESTGKKGSFDLRVVDDGSKILITMKDDGKPYNPILKYKGAAGCNAEEANLSLVILNAFCPDLNYKYINGINCLYMNFPYKK